MLLVPNNFLTTPRHWGIQRHFAFQNSLSKQNMDEASTVKLEEGFG